MGKKGLKDIKNQNTNLVMQQIMQARSISRIELAQETGLSPSTVSSIVGDLLGKGIIVEMGTQTVEKGRSRKDLSIAAEFGSVAVFEISRRSVFFCLFDMCLETLVSTCIAKQRVTGNDLFELLVETVKIHADQNIRGIGLLLHDDVQPSDLNTIYDTGYSSATISLQGALNSQLHIPVSEETCSSFTITNTFNEETLHEKVNCAHVMVGEKVFTTVTIDGQKVPLRSEFCKELLSDNTGTKEVSQLLNTLCTMFDIKKIFMMGTDFQFYQKLKLQNKDVELIQVHTEETDTLSPRMAEKVRNELLFI
ncbi:MAG: winged helix-turn-helix domain-containing protein [Solobacterium sp.]|nr:winged helix-turn-helix domain-containing protein [Solobacterium sp.]